MIKKTKIIFLVIILIIISSVLYFKNEENSKKTEKNNEEVITETFLETETEQKLLKYDLKTNTKKITIPFEEILSGGPRKDGIPALTNPDFLKIEEVKNLDDEILGILFKGEETKKFYPYNVLVWHEVINDEIDGEKILVTFCPLCGSAIVFSPKIENEFLEFGVSGLLWQSNLLMYDKKTESLWSQIEGKSVVGDFSKTRLEMLDSEVLSFAEVKEKYPETKILSSETGFLRNYSFYPYGNYDQNEDIYFPINNLDNSFPAKTLMYAGVYKEEPFAFVREDLIEKEFAEIILENGEKISAEASGGDIFFKTESGKNISGYTTFWFSWANHNEGVVWSNKK